MTIEANKKEIEDVDVLVASIFKFPMNKQTIAIILTVTSALCVPYLYFIGRFFDKAYYQALGVPIGILSNEFTETLLTGFTWGVLSPLADFSIFLIAWVPYFLAVLLVMMAFIYIPYSNSRLSNWLFEKFRAAVLSFGKERALNYLDDVDNKAKNANTTALLLRIIIWSMVIVFAFLAISWPALNAMKQAQEDAIKFITTADKTNCLKVHTKDCKSFAELTLITKPVKKLQGYIVSSSPKEWAIYQPPYITKLKTGKMKIIKRDSIVEVEHLVNLSALVEKPKEEKPKQ